MANIAIGLDEALKARAIEGGPGRATAQLLARGDGWTVEDVVCTSGPDDRPFEEQHARVSIAIVLAGTFQYRAAGAGAGREMMTPGSLLLGSMSQRFECGHEHATGDRCLSFGYTADFFERIAAGTRARPARVPPGFGVLRVPPIRAIARLVAQAGGAVLRSSFSAWEELSVRLAAETLCVVDGVSPAHPPASPGAEARVTRIVRRIEHEPDGDLTLAALSRDARLSPYHFLRVFERVAGVTPHQYVLRTRLRHAALRLVAKPEKVVDVAFECGFGDVSNFNRAFRDEFRTTPNGFRRTSSAR